MFRFICTCVATLLTFTTFEVSADDWAPKQAALMTRWAADVAPNNVHPDYPRPQLVRENWSNLNGLWQYAIQPRDAAKPDEWQGEILVPFPVESALSGVMQRVGAEKRLWYRRQFDIPKMDNDGRLLLHFGAVDWQCEVWVNGKSVGKHTGGYDPFTFDITDAIVVYQQADVVDPAGGQEIVVAVWDPTDANWQPRGKQVNNPHGIWYTPVTGIWQTVWLEPVPVSYIRSVTITPDLDNKSFTIQADVVNPQPGWKIGYVINSQSKSGGIFHRAWHTDLTKPIVTVLKEEEESRLAAHIWSPDNPHLIDVYVALVPDAKADLLGFAQEWMPKVTGPGAPEKMPPVEMADRVSCYTALRKISTGKDKDGVTRLLLNNKPLFQYGPLDQGWWPDGLYTAPTDEALRYDIEITKQLGFNMIRKHVKVEPDRWYYWCDKLGMLVWQDMPSGDRSAEWNPNGGHDGKEIERSKESAENFDAELKAMIDALRNHPSIVMWVPFNEAWGQFDTVRVTEWIHKYDPTRLVNCASGGNDFPVGDVYDIHRYPGPAAPEPDGKRAIVLGEYGGLGLPLEGHTWLEKGNWGYRSFPTREALTEAYLGLVTQLRPLIHSPGLAAGIYTQTTDVEVEVNGLLSYDRAVIKLPLEAVAAANRKLYLPPPVQKTLVPTAEKDPVTWRYTTETPPDNWFEPEFDASSWKEGPAGFGQRNTPGANVRTEWQTPDIWLVRVLELPAAAKLHIKSSLHLRMHHDEDAQVFLNGVLVKKVAGFTTDYGLFPIADEGQSLLRTGKNVIAVHCHQTGGGQYIDVGIVDILEAP